MSQPDELAETAARYLRFEFAFADRPLEGRVVAVAGATGGLGAATAVLLASKGCRLILGYRSSRDRAEALAGVITARAGTPPILIAGALEDADVRARYRQAAERLGGLDGLAIFAGRPARIPPQQLTRDALVAALEPNFIGPVLLARELGEDMEARARPGSIVLLASMQAVAPFSSSLAYGPAKAALAQAARVLARQWRYVNVNVVAPGVTLAGMAQASVAAGKYDACLQQGLLRRFGRAEDIARLVCFLLEPDHYITGQIIVADGGLTLRGTL
jgi:NAD(P)-dependent dehydrogenase (short-subunit alcohol dehydrogenase family)